MGGSCVDAAIAALLCEGIISLHNSGIGGGHMMTIYKRDERKTYILDARECAPLAAHEDLFQGGSISSRRGMLAACVPGEIMGLWEAHKKFGILPWEELFQPAINFAQNGFTVSKRLSNSLKYYEKQILASPSIRDILAPDGQVPKSGEKMILPTFSNTLQKIASAPRGALELYDGSLTKEFISDVQKYGGIITEEDMARYKTRWMDEIVCEFNDDLTLHSIPCPGSGVVLALILRLIENVCQFENNDRYKILIEAFKHGYALRSHLGDPSFTDVTLACDKINFEHISDIKDKIKSVLASNETQTDPEWYGGTFFSTKNRGTISLAVVSSNGDAVAATSTINLLFGCLSASPQTGIILNCEMDDFSQPGVKNAFGLSPSIANKIEPGKRPLSSMCPSVITDKNGDVRLVVGAAGGTHITSAVAQVILNYLLLGKTLQSSVRSPRLHHQLLPMEVKCEKNVSKDVIKSLGEMGHITKLIKPHSAAIAICRETNGTLTAACDARRGGSVDGY